MAHAPWGYFISLKFAFAKALPMGAMIFADIADELRQQVRIEVVKTLEPYESADHGSGQSSVLNGLTGKPLAVQRWR